MKKNHIARKRLIDLYFYFDYYYDYESDKFDYEELVKNNKKRKIDMIHRFEELSEKFDKKFSSRYGSPVEWPEYYGLFTSKNGSIMIDPKRFHKKIGMISDEQMKVMNKRNTVFYHPSKKHRNDYYISWFIDEIEDIMNNFLNVHKPIIDKSIENIKNMKADVVAGDYANFMMGISSIEAATAWANYVNSINKYEVILQKVELYNSLYAQFFHIMASRIEAVSVKFYNKYDPNIKKFTRDKLYDNLSPKKISPRTLPNYKSHDKLYCIWNFIKHNNSDTYETLKEKYPEVLVDSQYHSGELAIHYVKLNEELIIELLKGTEAFFIEWFELILDEKYANSLWDYEDWFSEFVDDEIENLTNPLGLTVFDEID